MPIGLIGTVWAYKSLHETGIRRPGRMDWWGNITFAIGLTALLAGITYGIQPYGGHTMGWTNPWVLAGLIGGAVMLVVFCLVEAKVSEPMFPLRLFRDAAFAGGNAATLLGAIARGGLQFMLIIWLQGIWLPLHGYDYADTPLWAGIYMLPLTIGFLLAGPLSGALSDKFGARLFAACGFLVMAVSFAGLLVLPSDFSYWVFAALIFLNGLGGGLFAAPNTAIIMSSVPADARGAASGMRATFQNAGMVLSMGVFFSLMVAGLAGTLPDTLTTGLTAQGVPAGAAHTVSQLPPVGVLFAAFLGYNPIQHLLGPDILGHLSPSAAAHLTGREFFPHLISQPFHDGLVVVFSLAIAMSLAAAGASLIRGRRTETVAAGSPSPAPDSHPATTATTTTSAPSTGVLRGRVHDSAGRPIARASLTLVDRSGRQRALASTGADGTYELTTRETSSYTLVVSATGHHPRAVQLDADAGPVVPDVTLAGLGSVNGTVRHEHTGEPVPDAQITLLSSSGEVVASAATNPDGTYTLQNLAPGAYTVVTSGYGPVLANVTLDEGNSRVVDLEVGHHDTD